MSAVHCTVQEGLASSRGSVSTLGRRRERRKSDSASIIGEPLDGAVSAGSQGAPAGKKDIGRVGASVSGVTCFCLNRFGYYTRSTLITFFSLQMFEKPSLPNHTN